MLYKIFDKNFGMTVAKYIKKQKINRAKELIKGGSSITEAAYVTGYNDCSYFSKVFKDGTGMSPSEYSRHVSKRKNLKQ
jgi:AraC-like DNA-binding protein